MFYYFFLILIIIQTSVLLMIELCIKEGNLFLLCTTLISLLNSRVGWNKRGGGAKVPELINEQVEINVEGGSFWKNST